MVLTSILNYKLIRKVRTKYLVRIFFTRKKSYAFFLSEKQYKKLYLVAIRAEKKKPKGDILVVIDDERERFVWCGVDHIEFSDKDWLSKHFNAKVRYNYFLEETEEVKVHVPEKIRTIPNIEPRQSLIR